MISFKLFYHVKRNRKFANKK